MAPRTLWPRPKCAIFHLEMRGRAQAQPRHALALQTLRGLMEEEFDYLVSWYTNRDIKEERQRVNWVNQDFMTDGFFFHGTIGTGRVVCQKAS